MDVGILGGTGPAGRGLALRLAMAGMEVGIGSRDPERAARMATEAGAQWPDRLTGSVTGVGNADAAAAPMVVLATPWEGAASTVRLLGDALAGKVVVSMANALAKDGREAVALVPARGSVAAAVQAAAPRARVAAAFHHLPASEMADLDVGLMADVLVCSDDADATADTMALVERIEGLRPLDAGSLSQASAIEAFTAVCITLNIRYRAHSTLKLAGI